VDVTRDIQIYVLGGVAEEVVQGGWRDSSDER